MDFQMAYTLVQKPHNQAEQMEVTNELARTQKSYFAHIKLFTQLNY